MSRDLSQKLSLNEICRELGLLPQFLTDLSENAAKYYHSFERPARSGGTRQICASQGRLKRFQRLLLDEFLSSFRMPGHVHGGVKNRSIASNARPHVNHDVVISLDLSKFFHSVSADKVKSVFTELYSCDAEAAEILSKLTTHSGCLPQGAPTSPHLANMAALSLDEALQTCCLTAVGAENFNYTRYIDDITISGGEALVKLLPEFDRLIVDAGFRRNEKKTRILRQNTRQWVTGVVVNKKLAPPKKILRDLRQHFYYCRKFGLDGHCDWIGMRPNRFLDKISGVIGYVRVTKPELADDLTFEFHAATPRPSSSEEELTLVRIKRLIDNESTASFDYDSTETVAAFSEIFVDQRGLLKVRGYELSPKRGWRTYTFSGIDRVRELQDI